LLLFAALECKFSQKIHRLGEVFIGLRTGTTATATANLFGDSSIVTPITGMLVMMSGTFARPLMLFDSLEQRFFKCTWLDNRAWAYSPLITVTTAATTTP
jgi:hypothetical protein